MNEKFMKDVKNVKHMKARNGFELPGPLPIFFMHFTRFMSFMKLF
jgi:hypothetical protein